MITIWAHLFAVMLTSYFSANMLFQRANMALIDKWNLSILNFSWHSEYSF